MIRETEKISVLNYNENRVSVPVAPNKSYSFEPSVDGINPTVIPMTMDEIKYANSSAAFRNGTLFFEKAYEEEIYEELNITNWRDILSNSDIHEIILRPTYDGLSKIIGIKDCSTFERVRAVYHKLKQEGSYDFSVRVAQIIDTRYKELQNRQINTSIVLTKKDLVDVKSTNEISSIMEQNASMQDQIKQMQELINQLMASQKATNVTLNAKDISDTSKKSPGRPKKNVE